MKKLSINWNESYEVNPERPQDDIALIVDSKSQKIWIRGLEFKFTKKRFERFKQIEKLAINNNIISLLTLDDINKGCPCVESIQRFLERFNTELRDFGKQEAFIPTNVDYHYILNTDGYYQNMAII